MRLIVFYFFVISCECKTVSDEVDLFHTYKHESFLQINTMIFDGDGQAFPKFPKKKVFNVSTYS